MNKIASIQRDLNGTPPPCTPTYGRTVTKLVEPVLEYIELDKNPPPQELTFQWCPAGEPRRPQRYFYFDLQHHLFRQEAILHPFACLPKIAEKRGEETMGASAETEGFRT